MRLAILIAVLFGSLTPAWAQSTATLQGTITDAQNAVMPGVTVTLRNVATGLERAAVTDAEGQYVAASLRTRPATQVVAHLEGFQDQNARGRARRRADRPLSTSGSASASLAENVTVSGASPAHRDRDGLGRPGDGGAHRSGDSAERPPLRRPRAADARRRRRRRRTPARARRCAARDRSRSCRPATARRRST